MGTKVGLFLFLFLGKVGYLIRIAFIFFIYYLFHFLTF